MKIDRTKLKKNSSEPPGDCSWLIERLRTCSDEELLPLLMSIETWSYGKCELHHWVDVLDRFDSILEAATKRENKWVLPCNMENNSHMLNLVIYVLHFTTLLVEHSFSRHLYSSIEHLITLLSSSAMSTVLAVLNLLYMFSKRSNFITRLACEPRNKLLARLIYLAESWGGKENGFGLAHCCKEFPLSSYPDGATSLSFEYYSEQPKNDVLGSPVSQKSATNVSNRIHITNVHQIEQCCSQIMEEILDAHKVPELKQMLLFTHLRLAQSFGKYELRLQCVQARLQAISILVYCNALQDSIGHTVLYSGLLDEFVDVLELKDPKLTEIKAATLRTLTSIIHLERLPNFPKLNTVIEVTGAASYHGFLPVLVRSCITNLTSDPVEPDPFPAPLATSLFSFLYHLASYESGGEALVSCAMMESLLAVVNWIGTENDHITFVTRAVRVIDLITNLDMNAFQNHGGPNIFIKRLEFEVDQCRKEQPFVIQLPSPSETQLKKDQPSTDAEMAGTSADAQKDVESSPMEVVESNSQEATSLADASTTSRKPEKPSVTCLPQRAALLKSMLNFLKKDIQDPGFNDHLNLRHLMEGSLPNSLKHIISNAEYYGPSLFLLATDVVAAYVYGEPSLLSFLQENGLTDVVLHALLIKDVPATREVLGSLPNVFSALCLNSAGLQSFVACKPFERLFKVLLSPDYLPAMRRRRSSDPMGDTASNLGSAMDELMRHQPSLKPQAMKAIVKLLHDLCLLGFDSHYVCAKANAKTEEVQLTVPRNTTTDSSSDEEEDDDEGESASNTMGAGAIPSTSEDPGSSDKRSVPLVDYVLNIMKFVDAILSNNSTDDHCKEFVTQKGLSPLLSILGLPNLPIDFATSQACLSVSSVCKSILSLAQEKGVLQQGLAFLLQKLEDLSPLNNMVAYPGGSLLLKELVASSNPQEAINSPQSTPLLHSLSAVHAYLLMLSQVCRTSQHDIRHLAIKQWGSELGLKVLTHLAQLYSNVTAEAAILYAICNEVTPKDADNDRKQEEGTTQPMETAELEQVELTRFTFSGCPFDASSSKAIASSQEMKLLKPLLQTTIRLVKTLGDLFTLLVKLCVGSPPRQRRGQQINPTISPPTPAGIPVAGRIAYLLHTGLTWSGTFPESLPRFRKSFYVCSLRFFGPLLFDDKKMPYHFILYQFVETDGLKAFFDAFEWALSTAEEGKSKPEAPFIAHMMGEFLDAWLLMLEKLVNPTNMLDSPYSLPPKHPFCPLRFLIHIHKRAFDAIMKLWNRKPIKLPCGVKISETMLSILCFILKGESIISERLSKEKKDPVVPGSVSPSIATGAGVTDSVPPAVPLSVQALPAVNEIRLSSLVQSSQTSSPYELESSFPSLAMTPGVVRFEELNENAGGTSIVPDVEILRAENTFSNQVADAAEATVTAQVQVTPITQDTPAAGDSARTSGLAPRDLSAVAAANPTEPAASNTARGGNAFTDPMQSLWLQSLLDMGFPQDRCVDAIPYCNTLEQATEYLLTNQGMDSDMDFSEDDQWFQAVTMSLKDQQQATTVKPADSTVSASVVESHKLSKEKLDEFCSTVLEGCLEQLDVQPQLVYKASFLMATCVTRNGKKWQEDLLRTLMSKVRAQAFEFNQLAASATDADTAAALCHSRLAAEFGTRLHLLTLLFEEMKGGCTSVINETDIVDVLINLICHTEVVLSANTYDIYQCESQKLKEKNNKEAPKDGSESHLRWLSPALLLLDLYEKLSISQKRKAAVKVATSHAWRWFDAGVVKWHSYGANNKIINEAYWGGESSVRIVNGRRKYLIQFNSMVQVNEESHYRRPIMIGISDQAIADKRTDIEKEEKPSEEEKDVVSLAESLEEMEQEQPKADPIPQVSVITIKGFTEEQQQRMIRACIGFIELGMEPDTLHALMMLSLRVTREWENARLFANLGGIKILIGLSDKSAFWGFQTLLALLMRHILEEPATLKNTMKKVIRYAAASNTSSIGTKELHSLLRTLAPAACRDSAMFAELTQQYLRVDTNMAIKRNSTGNADEIIYMKSINMKSSSTSSSQTYSDKQESKQLIYDLLEALVMNAEDPPPAAPKEAEIPSAFQKKDTSHYRVSQADARNLSHDLSRSSSANDMVVQELEDQSPLECDGGKVVGADSKTPGEEQPAKRKPLLTRPSICRLLAEFIRSYAGVAKLITEHQYIAGTSENITEDCSAMSYLLDQLMCSDGEMAALVKVVIAALASCNHSVEAQTALVSEIKNYFTRVMILPESVSKHAKLQSLVGIISTIIESCPSQINPLISNIKHPMQSGMNNIIKILIKKNVVTDLARIPHCLDLSSPNMATTINAALKPLENILRVVNTPCFVTAPKKKTSQQEENQQHSENMTTNSEATRAQGEENAEDVENTEHDISTTAESLEPSSDMNPNEDVTLGDIDEAGLEEIIDQLIEDRARPEGSDRRAGSRSGVSATVAYVLDDDTPMDTDDTLHDSRMVSQSESQFLDDTQANNDNDNNSSEDDDNEADGDDGVDDDDDEDDDDDPDDDDGSDEEDEGSVYDGYEDLDEAFLHLAEERDVPEDIFLPYYQRYMNTIDTIIFGSERSMFSDYSSNLQQLTTGLHNDDPLYIPPSVTNNSISGLSASSIPTHPLFQNPRDVAMNAAARVNYRPSRQRGVLRLLGQSQQQVLQLSNLREVFITNGDGWFVQSDSEDFAENQETGNMANAARIPSTLPSVPNALTRWTEEARVLEYDSMHDAVTELKPALMAVLEMHRKVEMAEKDKKKKDQDGPKNTTKSTEPLHDDLPNLVCVTPDPTISQAIAPATTSAAATDVVSILNDDLAISASSNESFSRTPAPMNEFPPIEISLGLNLQEPSVLAVPEAAPASTYVQDSLTSASDTLCGQPSSGLDASTMETAGASAAQNRRITLVIAPVVRTLQDISDSRSSSDADMATLSSPNTGSGVSSVDQRNQDEEMCVSPPAYSTSNAIQPSVQEDQPVSLPMEQNVSQPPTLSDGNNAEASSLATDEEKADEANRLTEAASGDAAAAMPSTSTAGNEYTAILGDIEIPEGVDPSFLAALPEDMRREVIAEQLRIQQVQRRATENRQETSTTTVTNVSPEFLAALPPNIQEEVMTQQRLELQRQQVARTSQDDPVSFFQTLPSTLRQTILADLEESQFSVLPPDVAQEAQQLRTQREERTRNVSDHMFRTTAGSSLSHILRHTARLGSRFLQSAYWSSSRNLRPSAAPAQALTQQKIKGQQVLDCEAVTCLLVLLFVDEPKLNTIRLHRVIKTLCYNPPTREWIIKTLLSIIQRCGENSNAITIPEESSSSMETGPDREQPPITSTPVSSSWKNESKYAQTSSWLSMSIDAALVCRANIFQVRKITTGGKKNPGCVSGATVHIHPQAGPLVCRHIIDLLCALSKTFPDNFLPVSSESDKEEKKAASKKSATPSTSTAASTDFPDFWEVLVKLDSMNASRKSKSVAKPQPLPVVDNDEMTNSLIVSPLGQLVQHLAHPVIKKSSLLTDRFLRLLSVMSQPLRDTAYAKKKGQKISDGGAAGIERLLGLAIQVLTSKSCTEEGLEDITALIIHLSHGPPPTRDIVLKLLLQGAVTLGQTVTSHIAALLVELKTYNSTNASAPHDEEGSSSHPEVVKKGVLRDRFTREEVVLSSSKTKQPCEIQLPSMSTLISKTSSQAFFLRTLKVIIQLRDATRVLRSMDRLQVNVQRLNMPLNSNPEPPRRTTEGNSAAVQMEVSAPVEDASTKPPDADSPEAMEVDQENQESDLKSLSTDLHLEDLWFTLSECLVELGETPDTHAVLVLQPAVEAFFLVHAFSSSPDKKPKASNNQETREAQLAHLHNEIAPLSPLPASGEESEVKPGKSESETLNVDSDKFIKFGEMHRSVLNQILRQSTVHLADGPFRVLVDHTRLLDFDIKRKYFRTELDRADEGVRREDLAIHVRREHVFEDSYRELHRRNPEEWKNRFYIVFEGEEGQDAGGLLREWYVIISREIFNPMYALFCTSPGDRVTYMINPASHCNSNHLSYFKFVGRVIAKAVYDNKLLECYFTRSFYKNILGKMVRVSDMESEDYSFYQGLIYLIENRVVDLGYELTFSTEVREFGVTEVRDLKPDGRNIAVTEETKMEYIRLVCQEKMKGAIKQQLNSFLEGFYDIIPKRLISIFNEQELELLISGLPTIDIEDLKSNTEYHKYTATSLQIQWFWRSLRSFDQAERAKLVQFVTGTSKVPLQGFAALEGMNGVQKFQIHKDERSTDRLPSAHTCFNQLDLPVYETYDKLRHYLLKAIQECSEGFGFA